MKLPSVGIIHMLVNEAPIPNVSNWYNSINPQQNEETGKRFWKCIK